MTAPMVDPTKIGSWEGAVLEHSRRRLSPLRAPLRDASKEDGLPSLCSAIDAIEGRHADGDAMGAAATRTLMAASSMVSAGSRQYVGDGAGQCCCLRSDGTPTDLTVAATDLTVAADEGERTEGSDGGDESDAKGGAQARLVRQRVDPTAQAYQVQGTPPQQQVRVKPFP